MYFFRKTKNLPEREALPESKLFLIFQSAVVSLLPELAPWSGCRGFTGPFPPPLWMSPVDIKSTVLV
jgi:hypothetical protein